MLRLVVQPQALPGARRRKGPVARVADGEDGSQKPPRATSHKVVNSVFGNAHGQFKTRGDYATAADEGTGWRTSDRCDGTLFKVSAGMVTVIDFAPPPHDRADGRAPATSRSAREAADRRPAERSTLGEGDGTTGNVRSEAGAAPAPRSGGEVQGAPRRRAPRPAVPGAARRRRASSASSASTRRDDRDDRPQRRRRRRAQLGRRGLAPARADRGGRGRVADRRRRPLAQRHLRQRPARRRRAAASPTATRCASARP